MTNKDAEDLLSIWIAKRDRKNSAIDIVLSDIDGTAGGSVSASASTGHADNVDGQYTQITLSSNDTWTVLMEWDISISDEKDWGGKFLVLSCTDPTGGHHSADMRFKVKLGRGTSGVVTLSETKAVTGNGYNILPLGIIDLMPGFPYDGGDPPDVELEVRGYTTSQPVNWGIDCLMLLPLDDLRVIGHRGNGSATEQNDSIVDDAITGWLYDNINTSQKSVAIHESLGEPVYLDPTASTSRIFFVQEEWTVSRYFKADREIDVEVKYQPRTEFLIGT